MVTVARRRRNLVNVNTYPRPTKNQHSVLCSVLPRIPSIQYQSYQVHYPASVNSPFSYHSSSRCHALSAHYSIMLALTVGLPPTLGKVPYVTCLGGRYLERSKARWNEAEEFGLESVRCLGPARVGPTSGDSVQFSGKDIPRLRSRP